MINQRQMDLMEYEAETRVASMLEEFMDAWLGDRKQWLESRTEEDIIPSSAGIPGQALPERLGQPVS